MVRIDEELLKRRAEHNDGILSTLKEVTLHQFEIEKIENLHLCRQLEIVYLQSNRIEKLENLSKLKNLKYLNLAVNRITEIENLQGCESLQKLDLTANYISNLKGIANLSELEHLRELYLIGNPCSSLAGYRHYIIQQLPQLQSLDGLEIEKSEKIEARQKFEEINQSIDKEIHDLVQRNPIPPSESPHNEEKITEKHEESDAPSFLNEDGTVMQKNEGNWKFMMKEEKDRVTLNVCCGKYLDTSFIQINAQPKKFCPINVLLRGLQ
eukprot:TRINITY_DN8138_c0_g1_i2.p1 TRINITY_DN8138_c0_g1~~TRINITY_DN8138_c0_g1_i2.p1  ORF type:complete len:267 (+),score=70.44 TRINITY_DN8138_c0_g1_i2:106-906(+)